MFASTSLLYPDEIAAFADTDKSSPYNQSGLFGMVKDFGSGAAMGGLGGLAFGGLGAVPGAIGGGIINMLLGMRGRSKARERYDERVELAAQIGLATGGQLTKEDYAALTQQDRSIFGSVFSVSNVVLGLAGLVGGAALGTYYMDGAKNIALAALAGGGLLGGGNMIRNYFSPEMSFDTAQNIAHMAAQVGPMRGFASPAMQQHLPSPGMAQPAQGQDIVSQAWDMGVSQATNYAKSMLPPGVGQMIG